MPPIKPDVCVTEGRIGLFIGGAYQFLTVEQARDLVIRVTDALDQLVPPKVVRGVSALQVDGGHVPGKYRLADKLVGDIQAALDGDKL